MGVAAPEISVFVWYIYGTKRVGHSSADDEDRQGTPAVPGRALQLRRAAVGGGRPPPRLIRRGLLQDESEGPDEGGVAARGGLPGRRPSQASELECGRT